MIPNIDLLLNDIKEYQYGNETYKINLSDNDFETLFKHEIINSDDVRSSGVYYRYDFKDNLNLNFNTNANVKYQLIVNGVEYNADSINISSSQHTLQFQDVLIGNKHTRVSVYQPMDGDATQIVYFKDDYGDYTLDISLYMIGNDFIDGFTNDLDAIKQTIYLILNTERYMYNIYSWDYGVELVDLIGQPFSYVTAVLPTRIKDALTQDDRIKQVKDFDFTRYKNKIFATFTVVTNIGDIESELEVMV